MVKKKKKRSEPTEEKSVSSDTIDLQALISDLKAGDRAKSDGPVLPMEEEEEKEEEEEEEEEDEKISAMETELLVERETLKKVGEELMKKKKQLAKLRDKLDEKWSEVKEKETAIKRATEILIKQKGEIESKEKEFTDRQMALDDRQKAIDAKEKALAEFKDKTHEMDSREMRLRAFEDDIKERELRVKRLEEDIAKCARCSAKDNFKAIELIIEELKDFGIHDREAEETLSTMRGDMEMGNSEAAFEKGERLMKRLIERRSGEVAKGLTYLLVRAEGELRHAREHGRADEELDEPTRWLNEARGLMERKEYKSAEHYIREAMFKLQTLSRGFTDVSKEVSPAPLVEPKTYSCPSCSTSFTIDSPERPVKVSCPGCHMELVIKEEVSYG